MMSEVKFQINKFDWLYCDFWWMLIDDYLYGNGMFLLVGDKQVGMKQTD